MNGAGGTSGPAAVGGFGGRNVIGMKPEIVAERRTF